MKNMKWMSAALVLTLGLAGAATLASAQHSTLTPVTQIQTAQTDLPETGDIADTADLPGVGDAADTNVDQPEAGDVTDQASTSTTDLPEAGDTVDASASN